MARTKSGHTVILNIIYDYQWCKNNRVHLLKYVFKYTFELCSLYLFFLFHAVLLHYIEEGMNVPFTPLCLELPCRLGFYLQNISYGASA